MLDAALFVAALIGLAAGGFLVARSPAFWLGMFLLIWSRVSPFLLKRLPPEDEAKIQEAYRRGEDTYKVWLEIKRKQKSSSTSNGQTQPPKTVGKTTTR